MLYILMNGLIKWITKSTGTVHTSAKERLTNVAIRTWIRYPDRHKNLITCSLAHCQSSLKISCKPVQYDRQTNNDENINITPLAEVTRVSKLSMHRHNGS